MLICSILSAVVVMQRYLIHQTDMDRFLPGYLEFNEGIFYKWTVYYRKLLI